MHHAVWASPAGELIDPTNAANTLHAAGTTTFVRDERIPADDLGGALVMTRVVVLSDDPLVQRFKDLYEAKTIAA